MSHFSERPCAAAGLKSYRYRYGSATGGGFIMIGALDDADALREARRSLTEGPALLKSLERWNAETGRYEPCADTENK